MRLLQLIATLKASHSGPFFHFSHFESESELSEAVNLLYPPIFDDGGADAAPIVVLEESEEPVNVVLSFHASPKPDNESVTWVVDGEILVPGNEVKPARWSNRI